MFIEKQKIAAIKGCHFAQVNLDGYYLSYRGLIFLHLIEPTMMAILAAVAIIHISCTSEHPLPVLGDTRETILVASSLSPHPSQQPLQCGTANIVGIIIANSMHCNRTNDDHHHQCYCHCHCSTQTMFLPSQLMMPPLQPQNPPPQTPLPNFWHLYAGTQSYSAFYQPMISVES